MPRIALIPAHRASPELKRAYGAVADLWGFAAHPPIAMQIMQCFGHRPEFVEHVAKGYHYIGWCGRLPRTVRELVAVLVSRENECFY
jgi:alkylhydroperoxidase family enzyme